MSPFASLEALRAEARENPAGIVPAVERVLHNLEGLGRELGAVAHVAGDAALRQAIAIARQLERDPAANLPPLAGAPLAHKDLYQRAGWPCEGGSASLAGHLADCTARVLEKLDSAYAIDCGRLTSVEFGLGTLGHNAHAGTPANPWNPAYICGGSSSGCGAAVAAGIVPAALGSDTGGSVRLPAAACGLVGIKPTHGLVGRSGVIALSPTLDTVGPLTRSVRDAAIMLQAITGSDPGDPSSIPVGSPDLLSDIEGGIDDLRVGLPANHFFEGTDCTVAGAVVDALRLAEQLGAGCNDIPVPGIETANALTMLITAVEGFAHHERTLLDSHRSLGDQTVSRLLVGAFIGARDYHNAIANRGVLARRVLAETFAHIDVLLTPVWPYLLPTIAESDAGGSPAAAGLVLRSGHNTRPVNYLGFPAVTLPLGLDRNGLPLSAQLIGAPFSEPKLLRLARCLEREIDFWQVRPQIHVSE